MPPHCHLPKNFPTRSLKIDIVLHGDVNDSELNGKADVYNVRKKKEKNLRLKKNADDDSHGEEEANNNEVASVRTSTTTTTVGSCSTCEAEAATAAILYLNRTKLNVSGKVVLTIPPSKKKRMNHSGVWIELVGRTVTTARAHKKHDFLLLQQQLAPPGVLLFDSDGTTSVGLPFSFRETKGLHDTYFGKHFSVSYFLKVIIKKSLPGLPSLQFKRALWIRSYCEGQPPTQVLCPAVDSFGLQDFLLLDMELVMSAFHLRQDIIGVLTFSKVRVKLRSLSLTLNRCERVTATTNNGRPRQRQNPCVINETGEMCELFHRDFLKESRITEGQKIKFRVRLEEVKAELVPTMVDDSFSVKYYLYIILTENAQRKYFYRKEISLWRREDQCNENIVQTAIPIEVGSGEETCKK